MLPFIDFQRCEEMLGIAGIAHFPGLTSPHLAPAAPDFQPTAGEPGGKPNTQAAWIIGQRCLAAEADRCKRVVRDGTARAVFDANSRGRMHV